MRKVFYGFLLAVSPITGLVAQTTSSADAQPPQLPPAMQNLAQELKISPVLNDPAKPTSELDTSVFFVKNLLANPSTALPDETRTPAQLEALLTTYVGTWRGESFWFSTSALRSVRAPIELVYKMEKENGRNVLNCTITYTLNGVPSVALSRLWVEDGHIFSEVIQDKQRQKYIAESHADSLVWRSFGSMDTLLDFSETETLHLTADGGQISTAGFEVQHDAHGSSLVLETTNLKLLK